MRCSDQIAVRLEIHAAFLAEVEISWMPRPCRSTSDFHGFLSSGKCVLSTDAF
ncbi:hypothetical protein IE4803_PB00360 (plasmid) [Rhizobium etli bv. phaseoli str. IE4803]|nr:hypothetical protein IE4803_PB00360 [Rhizobium etli bv. phaseoli str. IE4803]